MNKLLVQLTVDELKDVINAAIKSHNIAQPKLTPHDETLKVYRRKELADLLGVTVQTINAWVRCGQLPKPTKIGRIPVFSHDQIKHLFNG